MRNVKELNIKPTKLQKYRSLVATQEKFFKNMFSHVLNENKFKSALV